MKKLISIALLLAMCLTLFAGCQPEAPAATDLDNAVAYLQNMYKGSGGKDEDIKITGDKEILAIVTIGGVKYDVEWSVKVTSGAETNVTIADGSKDYYKKIDLADVRETETKFTLTATVKDAEGNEKSVSFNYVAPEAKPVEVEDNKEVVLYFPADGKYVTSVVYEYTSSNGTKKNELVLSDKKSDAMVLVMKENEGKITFATKDGKFLYCDGTNVELADAEGEFTVFTLEAADGGSYIKSNAFYNGNPEKPQYLEVYSGYLTCYGLSDTSDVKIYTFTLEDAEGAGTTTPDVPGNDDDNKDDPVVPSEGVDPTGMTQAEIVDAAWALKAGEAMVKPATLTGKVIEINTAYSEQYGNVTVTIVVEGKTDKPIECFRLKGDEAAAIVVGDTITVTGTLKHYVNGDGSVDKIEFDAGCTLDKRETAGGTEKPGDDVTAILDAAFALKDGESLAETVTLTGEIVDLKDYNEQYGDRSLTIKVQDKEIYCYALKGNVQNLKVGDVITVTGTVKNYKGTIEFDKAQLVSGGSTQPTPPADSNEDTSYITSAPEAGKTYKLGLYQGSKQINLYFSGNIYKTYAWYMEGVEDKAAAMEMTIEAVDGGFRMFFEKDGKKTYLDAHIDGEHFSLRLTDAPTAVWTWNTELNTFVVDLDGTVCFIGTSGTYTSISCNKMEKLEGSFVAHLFA